MWAEEGDVGIPGPDEFPGGPSQGGTGIPDVVGQEYPFAPDVRFPGLGELRFVGERVMAVVPETDSYRFQWYVQPSGSQVGREQAAALDSHHQVEIA